MTKLPSLLVSAFAWVMFPASIAFAADLTVKVTDLRNNQGDVHIAVYDVPEKFPDGDGMLIKIETMISDRSAEHTFTGLKPGFYAIAVYHDENSNDDFDTNFIGLPMEGYAFSNKATVFLSPPSFEAAQIALPESGAQTEIKMGY